MGAATVSAHTHAARPTARRQLSLDSIASPLLEWTPATGILESGTRACRLRPTFASWKRPRSFTNPLLLAGRIQAFRKDSPWTLVERDVLPGFAFFAGDVLVIGLHAALVRGRLRRVGDTAVSDLIEAWGARMRLPLECDLYVLQAADALGAASAGRWGTRHEALDITPMIAPATWREAIEAFGVDVTVDEAGASTRPP
jgi:hypothetical protein